MYKTRNSLALFFSLATCCGAQMDKQAMCAAKVNADIQATRHKSPNVFSTIRAYTFEYSRSHESCVIVIQYNTEDKKYGEKVQILAVNAVTMQPMEGHENVFLEDRHDTAAIEKAANFLFDKYSR